MKNSLEIAFFGSSLVSAYWNGAATYYRGMLRALAARGHRITFYEPDAYDRQAHRDIPDPTWATVVVYPVGEISSVLETVHQARKADLIVKASGVGVHDALLEEAVLNLKTSKNLVVFWDVDAPATLERLASDESDPFHTLIPLYDFILTYGGGTPVIEAYEERGAKQCVPIYNALDPETHFPVQPEPRFAGDLGFLGNRLPDREARVEEFFFRAAERLPARKFLLGGSGWGDRPLPANVRYAGHVYTRDHNAFNSTPTAVLNINRASMARFGFSPPTRVFEAAGAGACLITDAWEGIELFLEPGREVLLASSGAEVAQHLEKLDASRARTIGIAARHRILSEHTYTDRVAQLEKLLGITHARVATPMEAVAR
jgi:spore maturation protein CgeB